MGVTQVYINQSEISYDLEPRLLGNHARFVFPRIHFTHCGVGFIALGNPMTILEFIISLITS
jgi:hypothetical protein